MATEAFIESLHIEDNVFELKEDTMLEYLVHYAAPFTGDGQISVPAGVRFAAHGPMRDDALYMHTIDEENTLFERMEEKEKARIKELANRLMGFSFYITVDELNTIPLEFVSGSKDCLLEILQLIREEQAKPVSYKTETVPVDHESTRRSPVPDDLPF